MSTSAIDGIFVCRNQIGYVSYEFRSGTMAVIDVDEVIPAETFEYISESRTVIARVIATTRRNVWNYNFTLSEGLDSIESGSIKQSAIDDPEGRNVDLELFYGEKNGKLIYTKQA